MKVIRIFNAQPEKICHLRARWCVNKHGDPIFLLRFFNVHIMSVNYAKFQKKFDSRTISRDYLKSATFVAFFFLNKTKKSL